MTSVNLEARLVRLEKNLHAWRWCSAGVIALGTVALISGAGRQEPPADLRVSSITLVAPDGTEVGRWHVEGTTPLLSMQTEGRHVALTLADGSAGLAAGGGVVFAGSTNSSAYFNARGRDLLTGVYVGVDEALTASMRAYPANLNVAASLDVPTDGQARLTLNDRETAVVTPPKPKE